METNEIIDELLISQLFDDNVEEMQMVEPNFDLNYLSEEETEPLLQPEGKVNQGTCRFKAINSGEIDTFLIDKENANTARKTKIDMDVLKSFLHSKGEERHVEIIPPTVLNLYLCEFLISVQKRRGGEYEPCSLRSFISSFDRHLRSKMYPCSIINSLEFAKTRDVLKCKQKHLKHLGKGNKPYAADPIDKDILDTFYTCGTLGDSSPKALLHSLWLICTINFGMRTGQEIHALKWGDIDIREDENGKYLVHSIERQTKTRTGINTRDKRACKARAYQVNDKLKDPVHLYQLYKSKRPSEMLTPESPFFLSIANKYPRQDELWFKRQALGINPIYGVMKTMIKDAGLQTDKRITPYSVRKHLIQKLNDNGVPAHQIIQISGHKNVNSLNNYSKLNPQQIKDISNILSNVKTPQQSLAPYINPKGNSMNQDFNEYGYNRIPSGFTGNTFNAPVTFNFDGPHFNKTMTQTSISSPRIQTTSPEPARKRWKRILPIDSESDSD